MGALLETALAAEPASTTALREAATEGGVLEAQQVLMHRSSARALTADEMQLMEDLVVATHVENRRLELAAALRIWKPTGTVAEGQYPWVVAVEAYNPIKKKWFANCTGSLIGKRTVLTAAHCAELPNKLVRIAYGSVDLDSPDVKRMTVSEQLRHKDFKRVQLSVTLDGKTRPATGAAHDFALIYTDGPLDIEPLSREAIADQATPPWRVVGWGQSDLENFPTRLAYGVVNPIDNAVCGQVYRPLDASMLCAGNAQTLTNFCEGDSGGPLIALAQTNKPSLIGIVSFTKRCEVPVGVYMKISAGTDWIANRIMD